MTSIEKYSFTLKGVNIKKVEERFGIKPKYNINSITEEHDVKNTTNISELKENKNVSKILSFTDESKKSHKCSISMIDFNTNKELTNSSIYECFWDRNKIPSDVLPIGCPIKYVPSQSVMSYYSEITKDLYTIKDNITTKTRNEIETKIIHKNYYVTDGIFCSFNCCMSYIEDNKRDSVYNMSSMLLLKMYRDIYPSRLISIEVAPHWRKLIQYGGDLNIDQFRNSFNKIEYENHGCSTNNINLPSFVSRGLLFEEKLKF
jgi:hypothetical protein